MLDVLRWMARVGAIKTFSELNIADWDPIVDSEFSLVESLDRFVRVSIYAM